MNQLFLRAIILFAFFFLTACRNTTHPDCPAGGSPTQFVPQSAEDGGSIPMDDAGAIDCDQACASVSSGPGSVDGCVPMTTSTQGYGVLCYLSYPCA